MVYGRYVGKHIIAHNIHINCFASCMSKNLPLRNIGAELVSNTNSIANFIHSKPALKKDACLPTPVPIEPLSYAASQYLICSFPVLYAVGAGAGAGGGAGA